MRRIAFALVILLGLLAGGHSSVSAQEDVSFGCANPVIMPDSNPDEPNCSSDGTLPAGVYNSNEWSDCPVAGYYATGPYELCIPYDGKEYDGGHDTWRSGQRSDCQSWMDPFACNLWQQGYNFPEADGTCVPPLALIPGEVSGLGVDTCQVLENPGMEDLNDTGFDLPEPGEDAGPWAELGWRYADSPEDDGINCREWGSINAETTVILWEGEEVVLLDETQTDVDGDVWYRVDVQRPGISNCFVREDGLSDTPTFNAPEPETIPEAIETEVENSEPVDYSTAESTDSTEGVDATGIIGLPSTGSGPMAPPSGVKEVLGAIIAVILLVFFVPFYFCSAITPVAIEEMERRGKPLPEEFEHHDYNVAQWEGEGPA